MNVLGVRIDEFGRRQSLDKLGLFLNDGKQHSVFTPNPEMLVDAQKDGGFLKVLNSGSLNICDGKGIELVGKGKLQRIPGIDFMLDICGLAVQRKLRVYLLGSRSMFVLEKTKKKIVKLFPRVNICGFDTGPLDLDQHTVLSPDTVDKINRAKPDVLFVGFGHIKQEKWIYENLSKLASVKVAMGVGGSFDMFSGKIPRAPRFLRSFGLEWLWRLAIEPRRIKRIWKATAVFLFYYLKSV